MIESDNNSILKKECFGGAGRKACLSVVVPAYNVENYLFECLSSILKNNIVIQLIVIDDGSTDKTGSVARKFFKWSGVYGVLITTLNRGLSASRNLGAKFAKGEYISFFDADDLAVKNSYALAIEEADRVNCDLVLCSAKCFSDKTLSTWFFNDYEIWDQIITDCHTVTANYQQEPRLLRLEPSAVLKVFRTKYYIDNKFIFPVGVYFEDIYAHFLFIYKAKLISVLNIDLFFYRVDRDEKITEKKGLMRFDIIHVVDQVSQDVALLKLGNEQGVNIIYQIVKMCIWCSESVDGHLLYDFYVKLNSSVKSLPIEWKKKFMINEEFNYDYRFYIFLIFFGKIEILCKKSFGMGCRVEKLLFNSYIYKLKIEDFCGKKNI